MEQRGKASQQSHVFDPRETVESVGKKRRPIRDRARQGWYASHSLVATSCSEPMSAADQRTKRKSHTPAIVLPCIPDTVLDTLKQR